MDCQLIYTARTLILTMGKHFWKLHCCNGVVDTFGHQLLGGARLWNFDIKPTDGATKRGQRSRWCIRVYLIFRPLFLYICCKSFAHSLVDTLQWIKLYAAPTLCVYTAFFTLLYELLTVWFHQFLIWNSEGLIFLTI